MINILYACTLFLTRLRVAIKVSATVAEPVGAFAPRGNSFAGSLTRLSFSLIIAPLQPGTYGIEQVE